ncbi:homeobox-leucine zipper protein HOX18 [Zea mays]|uniref:Putative homeobox DNA-binding and leucine zipper domain family protein n=1 Tax=Zea mays TaxID=4577 RepID=A0A1D6LP04_MAIZE|nr:homeobox-leucine zipper protein HOX18 [Zea mays]AQK81232.1 Putative homeobox DNA-binding and leucine zipper domain family protein [Zea mays]|eukprot:XP_008648902.1 homeobox-leucine zipper protein HOX18 [Zea mays]
MYTTTRAMEKEEGFGKSWLGLGIGGGGRDLNLMKRSRPLRPVRLDLLFPPSVEGGEAAARSRKAGAGALRNMSLKQVAGDDDGGQSSHGGPSPSDDDDGAGARKKLRLTTEQSKLLEDTFRAHNILSHAQKHEVARQVDLSARQVEVWFQNRRARTKLKQTEVDCETLRRWRESLADENLRLRLELEQLQRWATAAAGQSSASPSPATATASVCPSCDKVVVVTVTSCGETSGKSSTSSYSSSPPLDMLDRSVQ